MQSSPPQVSTPKLPDYPTKAPPARAKFATPELPPARAHARNVFDSLRDATQIQLLRKATMTRCHCHTIESLRNAQFVLMSHRGPNLNRFAMPKMVFMSHRGPTLNRFIASTELLRSEKAFTFACIEGSHSTLLLEETLWTNRSRPVFPSLIGRTPLN